MIEIRIVGEREVAARLKEVPAQAHRGLLHAVSKLGYQLEGHAKALVSGPMLQVRTGVGRSSINTQVADEGEGRGAAATVGIGRTAPYMAIQHQGVDHSWIIAAIRAKALRFQVGGASSVGGVHSSWSSGWIYRRSVMHPPLKAHPFLTQPLREMTPEIAPTIAAEVAAELAK